MQGVDMEKRGTKDAFVWVEGCLVIYVAAEGFHLSMKSADHREAVLLHCIWLRLSVGGTV